MDTSSPNRLGTRGRNRHSKNIMITPNATCKVLVTTLTALAGVLNIQATSPSGDHPTPAIVRGGSVLDVANVVVNPNNPEGQTVNQTGSKEPILLKGSPGPILADHNPSGVSLSTSTIEERLNRVEADIESQRREENSIKRMTITSVALAATCVFGLGLLAASYRKILVRLGITAATHSRVPR